MPPTWYAVIHAAVLYSSNGGHVLTCVCILALQGVPGVSSCCCSTFHACCCWCMGILGSCSMCFRGAAPAAALATALAATLAAGVLQQQGRSSYTHDHTLKCCQVSQVTAVTLVGLACITLNPTEGAGSFFALQHSATESLHPTCLPCSPPCWPEPSKPSSPAAPPPLTPPLPCEPSGASALPEAAGLIAGKLLAPPAPGAPAAPSPLPTRGGREPRTPSFPAGCAGLSAGSFEGPAGDSGLLPRSQSGCLARRPPTTPP